MCTTQIGSVFPQKQQIRDKSKTLVSQHVFSNITLYVDYMLNSSYERDDAPITYEDLYPFNTYYSSTFDAYYTTSELQDLIETYTDELQASTDPLEQDEMKAILDELTSLAEEGTPEEAEVFEWYIVSQHLADQLRKQGQIIINQNLWGRQSAGQAIHLDSCIADIALCTF